MSFRTSLLAIIAGLVGVILLYTGYWMVMRGVIEQEVRGWIAEQEAAGYYFESDALSVTGYPYRFRVQLDAPDMQAPVEEGGWQVSMSRTVAHASAVNFAHWIVSFEGPIILQLGAGAQEVYRIDSAVTAVSIVSGADGRTNRIGAEIQDLTLETLEGAVPLIRSIGDLRLSGEVLDSNELLARIEINGLGLNPEQLGDDTAEAFGDLAERFRLEARVTEWASLAADGDVMGWSEADGEIAISLAELIWGPVELFSDSGEFSLDDTAQLGGRISVELANPDRLIDALTEAGIVEASYAPGLRTAAMMAPRGQVGTILPLRFQAGRAYLGVIPLGRID